MYTRPNVYHYLRRQFLTKIRVYIFEQMCQLVAMWLGSSEKLIGLELSAGTTNLHVYPISLAWHVISGQKKTSLGFFSKKGTFAFSSTTWSSGIIKACITIWPRSWWLQCGECLLLFHSRPKTNKNPPAIRILKTIAYVIFSMRTL